MAQVFGVFAELERRLIAERTRAALAVKALRADGSSVLGPRVVERIVSARCVICTIARQLSDSGVPTAHEGTLSSPEARDLLESGTVLLL
jgi:hypothetical protein